jgi:hypothetical protein
MICPAGSACPSGAMLPTICLPGTFSDGAQGTCRSCSAGTFSSTSGSTACKDCRAGFYCPEGASTPLPCAAGRYGTHIGLQREEQCQITPPGFFSLIGSAEPQSCAVGTFASANGSASCESCPPGEVARTRGAIECSVLAGAWNLPAPVACFSRCAGRVCASTAMLSRALVHSRPGDRVWFGHVQPVFARVHDHQLHVVPRPHSDDTRRDRIYRRGQLRVQKRVLYGASIRVEGRQIVPRFLLLCVV